MQRICAWCEGSGLNVGAVEDEPRWVDCHRCLGVGLEDCDTCEGRGYRPVPGPCPCGIGAIEASVVPAA